MEIDKLGMRVVDCGKVICSVGVSSGNIGGDGRRPSYYLQVQGQIRPKFQKGQKYPQNMGIRIDRYWYANPFDVYIYNSQGVHKFKYRGAPGTRQAMLCQ